MLRLVFDNENCENFRFYRDGATAHATRESFECLTTFFVDNIISHGSGCTWPARTPVLEHRNVFPRGLCQGRRTQEKRGLYRRIEASCGRKCCWNHVVEKVYDNFAPCCNKYKNWFGHHLII